MIFTRVVIGAMVIAAGIVGREYRAAGATAPTVTSRVLTTPAVSDTVTPSRGTIDTPRIDLYGNEVDDAVGDYRVDGTGDLYETHSPDTEVTRLGVPGA